MAWRIVQQPNGLFARFSEIVDDFTHYGMTPEQADALCRQYPSMGVVEAKEKVQRGIDAGMTRFTEAIDIVREIHGDILANERIQQMSMPIQEERECVSDEYQQPEPLDEATRD